jgi:hypothetical protein
MPLYEGAVRQEISFNGDDPQERQKQNEATKRHRPKKPTGRSPTGAKQVHRKRTDKKRIHKKRTEEEGIEQERIEEVRIEEERIEEERIEEETNDKELNDDESESDSVDGLIDFYDTGASKSRKKKRKKPNRSTRRKAVTANERDTLPNCVTGSGNTLKKSTQITASRASNEVGAAREVHGAPQLLSATPKSSENRSHKHPALGGMFTMANKHKQKASMIFGGLGSVGNSAGTSHDGKVPADQIRPSRNMSESMISKHSPHLSLTTVKLRMGSALNESVEESSYELQQRPQPLIQVQVLQPRPPSSLEREFHKELGEASALNVQQISVSTHAAGTFGYYSLKSVFGAG